MANFDPRVMNILYNLQKRPLDDDTCHIYIYITCIKALGLVVLYINLCIFSEKMGLYKRLTSKFRELGSLASATWRTQDQTFCFQWKCLFNIDNNFQKEYQCALWMHYITVKVTRSNILVPIKRSWYKENTCEIWKLCLIVQKL